MLNKIATRSKSQRAAAPNRRASIGIVWLMLLVSATVVPLLTSCEEGGRGESERVSSDSEPNEILVFAAASLREAMEDLGKEFERETDVRVRFNFAGSNNLALQIVASTRADLYLSANESWMDTVEEAGRIVPGTRRDLLSNSLVVIAHPRMTGEIAEPCDLSSLPFEHLALGDPEAVPAGEYARDWLSGIECDGASLMQQLQGRIVPTPDVRAALGLVRADPQIIGIVYKTDQQAFSDGTRILHEVNRQADLHIRYTIARVDQGPSPEAAKRFLGYLTGPRGVEAFERHGFTYLKESS